MEKKRIVSVILVAVLMITSAAALISCKKEEEKPETLEEYIEASESAQEELKGISDSMSNDLLDGSMSVEGNSIVITMKFKEVYDDSYFDKMKDAMEDKLDEYKDTFNDAISDIQKSSGIEDVTLKMSVLNGDGTEIYNADLN